jgi:hypothetical protein
MQSTGNRRNFCGIWEEGKEETYRESSFVKTASRQTDRQRERGGEGVRESREKLVSLKSELFQEHCNAEKGVETLVSNNHPLLKPSILALLSRRQYNFSLYLVLLIENIKKVTLLYLEVFSGSNSSCMTHVRSRTYKDTSPTWGSSFYDGVSSSEHCIQQVPGSSMSIGRDKGHFDELRSFHQSLQANPDKVAPLGHAQFLLKFLPNRPIIQRYVVCKTGS